MIKKLYAIIGKMGSGKTTIVNEVSSRTGIEIVRTTTSRPIRDGEDKESYVFVDKDYFSENKDKFIEHKTYNTIYGEWHYGLSHNNIRDIKGEEAMVVLTPAGCVDIMKNLAEGTLSFDLEIIHITTNNKVRIERIISRGDNNGEVIRRMESDEIDFMDSNKLCPIYIDNSGDLEVAVVELMNVLVGDRYE